MATVITASGLPGILLSDNIDDYPEGIILPVDKPYRWTSADVIRKVKYCACRHFHKKNLKVGHAGTLDPLADGLLIVCIGKATRMAEEIQRYDKEYVAGVSFGATTPSYDLEKEIDRFYPTDYVSADSIAETLRSFLGRQEQVAPLFSAKSVDGIRAYELARKQWKTAKDNPGMPFDHSATESLSRQEIEIKEIELLSFRPGGGTSSENTGCHISETSDTQTSSEKASIDPRSLRINVTDNSRYNLPHADIRVLCSKGTYIRALARDIGEALGTGAHLDMLRRTRNGGFDVRDAVKVEDAVRLFGGK